jgi:hypothetical protein
MFNLRPLLGAWQVTGNAARNCDKTALIGRPEAGANRSDAAILYGHIKNVDASRGE